MSQDKRLFLALGLCIFVMVALQMLFPGKPLPRKPVPAKVPAPAPAPGANGTAPGAPPPVAAPPVAGNAVLAQGAGAGASSPVPAITEPVLFTSGRLHAMVRCQGASVGRTWLEGIPAAPGANASRESTPGKDPPDGALDFLRESALSQPGAFGVTLFSAELPLLSPEEQELRPFDLVSRKGAVPLVYRARPLKVERVGKGLVLEVRYSPTTDRDAWHWRMEVSVRNEDEELEGRRLELRVRGAALVHAPEGSRDAIVGRVKIRNTSSTKDMQGYTAQKAEQEHKVVPIEGDIDWVATTSTYFAAILDPDDPAEGEEPRHMSVLWRSLTPLPTPREPSPGAQPSPILCIPLGVRKPGVEVKVGFTLFVGPTANEIPIAGEYHPVLDREEYAGYRAARNHSFLFLIDIIADGLFYVLKGFHALVPSWGVAIVLLTVLVRGLMFPLSRKQLKSTIEYSKKMQKIKPKLDALKEKHGEDRRKMSEAQFRLMKEHDVPLMPGGCLLTFLQLPIWWALYQMLQCNYDLRQADFLWVQDLSQADHLMKLPSVMQSIPLVGSGLEWLNLLPLLMTATWFFSSKATMTPPADEQQAQMQAMMQYMPFIMLLFPGFYSMPAGLCLYITASSTWGIVESRIIRKRYAAPAVGQAPAA